MQSRTHILKNPQVLLFIELKPYTQVIKKAPDPISNAIIDKCFGINAKQKEILTSEFTKYRTHGSIPRPSQTRFGDRQANSSHSNSQFYPPWDV